MELRQSCQPLVLVSWTSGASFRRCWCVCFVHAPVRTQHLTRFLRAQTVLQTKTASVQSKEHVLLTFQLLCTQLGPAFEPYMLFLMPTILASISDTQAAIREAAEAAALAVTSSIAAQGVSLIMPPLLEAMGDRHVLSCCRTTRSR